jgi:hypothetical protein
MRGEESLLLVIESRILYVFATSLVLELNIAELLLLLDRLPPPTLRNESPRALPFVSSSEPTNLLRPWILGKCVHLW